MIQIVKGSDATIKITFSKNGVAFDITGYTILFTAKKVEAVTMADTLAAIKKNITVHTDPTHGISAISLNNLETDIEAGKYYWDIRLLKDGVISSTIYDILEITQNITIRKVAS